MPRKTSTIKKHMKHEKHIKKSAKHDKKITLRQGKHRTRSVSKRELIFLVWKT